MTSVVDTSVKFFTSKMPGAPSLKGQVGSLIAILDACLKDGWGVQTASSCVVASGVCTMTFPLDHAALVDSVILVAGASISALNGEQKVTAVAPNVVKFATAASNATATGTITAKMAPLGFNKPFSGTNLAVYKSADVAANGQYLRVNDTNALYARAVGYENMTAISTGTGLFPTSAQFSGGEYWHKSDVAGTVPVTWVVYGDSRYFQIYASTYMGNGAGYELFESPSVSSFGDLASLSRASDPFATILTGAYSTSPSAAVPTAAFSGSTAQQAYFPRASSGIGTAVEATPFSLSTPNLESVFDSVSGRVMYSAIGVTTLGSTAWRAVLPGTHLGQSVYMERAFAQQQVFRAGLPERSYLAILGGDDPSYNQSLKLVALDITGPIR